MAFHSLRARLLVVQSALVVVLTGVTLAYVSVLANRVVRGSIAADLAASQKTTVSSVRERESRLALVAQVVASFPQLKALFANADAATIRDFLSEYRQSHGLDELLVAIDAADRVLARTDTFAPLLIADLHAAWTGPAAELGRPVQGHFSIDGRLFQGALVAAESGGNVYGFVLAAAPVDNAWAGVLGAASHKEIVILSSQGVAASTVPVASVPWRSVGDLPAAAAAGAPIPVELPDGRFQAIVASSSPGPSGSLIRVISLQSQTDALRPYRNIQIGLLIIGLVAAGVGIGGTALLARSLAAPIGQLAEATRKVSSGTYDVSLATDRTDEIGDLSRSFNQMIAGLRERADMQKFVSQSTVDMIARHPQTSERRLGERREVTLLFCDIRGFTAFSEHCRPEDAVRVLNRYLSLQADLVKRFHGDVDKFIGDAVFAQFSGPDMALDAIRCAVEIQRAGDRAHVDDPALPALAVGVGIATGEVIVGSIGSDERLDHTAIGPAVNLSARLCAAAEPHEILMSHETFERVSDLVAAEAVAPLSVKGFTEPVRAYRMRLKSSVATGDQPGGRDV